MTPTTSPINIKDAIGPARLAQARSASLNPCSLNPLPIGHRLNALKYYGDGGLAPFEVSFPLGDDTDIRFVSVSFWRDQETNARPAALRFVSKS